MLAAGVLGLCLVLQEAAHQTAQAVFIGTQAATLAWTHSIEKTRWEEDLRVVDVTEGAGDAPQLRVVAARIRGSGAGMEPPEGALRRDGWYHYVPVLPPRREVALMRSPHVPDFELCVEGRCEPLSRWLPSDGGVTLLSACRGGG